jgi:GNAT superfamily N-acetyltransferase
MDFTEARTRFTMEASDFQLVEEPFSKFNPNHDDQGRFATSNGLGGINPDMPFDTTLKAKDGTEVAVVTQSKSQEGNETVYSGILTANGKEIGDWERRIGPDYVDCTGLALGEFGAKEKSPFAEKGIGTEFHKHTEEVARALGKENITVRAVSDGSYVWASEKFGYKFDPEKLPQFTWDNFQHMYKLSLGFKRINGKPTYFDEYNHPWLEKTENRDKISSIISRFKGSPQNYPTPAEILSLGKNGPTLNEVDSYRVGVWRDYTFGEWLLSNTWYGVKSSDHVTKMVYMIKLHIVGMDEQMSKFNPNHDERGRFSSGTGMGAGVATSILERVKANGGLSVNMVDGSEPTSGYMVAAGTEYGATVSAADFYDPIKGPKILADYMKKNKSDLGTGKNYLGLWHNTEDGNVYLDVSQNIQDKGAAIAAGQSRDQISIWDVANFAEIQTGGTGVTKQEVGSRGIADKHFGDDGFRDRGLRSKDLGKVSKTQVIYFAPGLKPVIKFNPHHDERGRFTSGPGGASASTSSNGAPSAPSGAWDEARLAELNTIKAKQAAGEIPTAQEFNDYLNSDMSKGIGNGTQLAQEMFNFEHTGLNRETGLPETLTSKVESVAGGWDGEINCFEVTGSIYNSKGENIGEFGRRIYADENGVSQMKNDILNLDPDYTGTGFGTGFLNHAENYLHALGVENQYVHAVRLAGQHNSGPFVWAKRGYGWDKKADTVQLSSMRDNVRYHIQRVLNQDNPDVFTEEKLLDIDERMRTLGFSHPNFPTPHEIAYTGWVPGAKFWAGQSVMGQSDWYGVKPIGPSKGR